VLAIMPHPERAQDVGAMPRAVTGAWSERRERMADERDDAPAISVSGPGLILFEGLRRYLVEAA
jgi:hypothetical protein